MRPISILAIAGFWLLPHSVCISSEQVIDETAAWYPSIHGQNDRIGAANYLSSERVVDAMKLIKQGKVYSLAIETGSRYPTYAHRSFSLHVVSEAAEPLGANRIVGNDDYLATWVGIGTHIDGLGHVGIDSRYYNGVTHRDMYDVNGLKDLSASRIPPLVGRAVLLDAAAYYGVDVVPAGTAINKAEILDMLNRQGIRLGRGDVVLLHTGWMSRIDSGDYVKRMPGIGVSGARYLAELGVVAVAADTAGVEVVPAEDPAETFPVHQELLTKRGVYLIENVNTRELANDKIYESFFVTAVPVIEGSVQAIVHPIAIH